MRLAALRCLWAVCLALGLNGAAHAQSALAPSFTPMADEPDPRDFVARSDSQLTLLGNGFRFGGVEIAWLGIRQDPGAPPRRPTRFEVKDAFQTAQAMGATVVRAPGLLDTAGCPLCLETAPRQLSEPAFAQADMVLDIARDLGIKLILPLADSGRDCSGADANGAICGTSRLLGSTVPHDFFYETRFRADFLGRVGQILQHRNSINGTPYRNDPTILAWEACESCAEAGGGALVSAWTEQLGVFIKQIDKHHLFESGAFAGHIGPGAKEAANPTVYATASVDIVGDRLVLTGDPQAGRGVLGQTVDGVVKSGHAYVLDNFGWSPSSWKSLDDLDTWLSAMAHERSLAGAITGDLQSHADQGGYLPAPRESASQPAGLYFPGTDTADMTMPVMRERDRALRRFNYDMADVTATPTYLLASKPEILSVQGGHVVWRGSAGAASYTIERSLDPGQPGSWVVVCDACTAPGSFDDAHFVNNAWYRVMPLNINGHKSSPSDAVQAK